MATTATTITQYDHNFIWHPFTRMSDWLADEPLIIQSGEGAVLRDINGREYIDAISSLWVNIHGHNRPEINSAIAEQLSRIAHSTLLGSANVPASILAKRLIEIAPDKLSRIFYSDNGSTAVEVALKQAFQYWQNRNRNKSDRRLFARLKYAYHGDTLGAVSVGGIELFHETYRPLLFETVEIPSPYCYRCPFGLERQNCGLRCLETARRIIAERKDEIAALIMEPLVQGAAGFIVHPEGFLSGMASICRENGILLILDEVAVGFGRTGTMFACQQENVQPDFLALSKGITGGYLPLGATLCTGEIFEAFLGNDPATAAFYHGHSYTGNQLACAAATASLDIFKTENVIDRLQPKIEQLARETKDIARLPIVGDARQKGLIAAFELVQEKSSKKSFPPEFQTGVKICRRMLKRGILMRPLGDVVYLIPPLSISEHQLDSILKNLFDVLKNFKA